MSFVTTSKYNKGFLIDMNTIFYKSSQNMSEVSECSVDLIITSPPYFNIKDYSKDGYQNVKHSAVAGGGGGGFRQSYRLQNLFYAQNTSEFITIYVKDGKPQNTPQELKEQSKLSQKEWV